MPSLINFCARDKEPEPFAGSTKIKRELILWPRTLPTQRLHGKRETRWLGIEKILYEYQTWKEICYEFGDYYEVSGWRAKEWYC